MRLLVSILTILLCSPVSLADTVLRLGISAALTGPASTYGTDVKNAAMFAARTVEGVRVEFVIEDDRCDSKEAVTTAHKLVHVDKVKAVIGPTCSGAAMAASGVYSRAGVVNLVPGASASGIADAGDKTFVGNPGNSGFAEALVSYISEIHQSVELVSDVTEYSQDVKTRVMDAAARKGMVVHSYDVLPSDRDLDVFLKIPRTRPLILTPGTEARLSEMLSKVAQQGDRNLYSLFFPGSPTFRNIIGDRQYRIVFADYAPVELVVDDAAKRRYATFVKEFGSIKTIEMNFFLTEASTKALIRSLLQKPEAPWQVLSTDSFPGPFGEFKFEDKRVKRVPLAIKLLDDQTIRVLKVVPLALSSVGSKPILGARLWENG